MKISLVLFGTVLSLLVLLPAAGALAQSGQQKELKEGERQEAFWVHYVKPGEKELRGLLTPLQYEVTQEEGTERPFRNTWWDNKRKGIYVDILSREPLFASVHKYRSGTGWPSFYMPLDEENIVLKDDYRLFSKRTEVRSRYGDNHLGHVFNDGPSPTGLRYCMNSAALDFVPLEDMERLGYGEYLELFKE